MFVPIVAAAVVIIKPREQASKQRSIVSYRDLNRRLIELEKVVLPCSFPNNLRAVFSFSLPSQVYSSHFRGGQKELKETAGGKQREKGKECVQLFLRLRPCQL